VPAPPTSAHTRSILDFVVAMYNGIGLLTPRGSGTSGYVQTNKFNIRGPPQQRISDQRKVDESSNAQRKPDQGILDHNRRREIELKCVQMADALEEQGCGIAFSRLSPCGIRCIWALSDFIKLQLRCGRVFELASSAGILSRR
jgi:serine/arginine repetitive matrix protein 2